MTYALQGIYADRHPRLVIRKAAQVFVSEFLVNTACWCPYTKQGGRGNALFVFPKDRQAQDFSVARIDKAIKGSPDIIARTEAPMNVGLKRIGDGFIYVRGAQTRESLISVDADIVLCDEIAQYPPGTIDVLEKRLGSSLLGWVRAGSTPRYPADEAGARWDQSTQSVYEVRCSHCGAWQAMELLTHLNAETARVACQHCRGDMTADRLSEGRWVAGKSDAPWHGYQLTKLLSPRVDLRSLADTMGRVLDGRATATQEQEFYNSDCGLPHLPEGGYVSASMLDACRDMSLTTMDTAQGAVMGVDVGKRLHVTIGLPLEGAGIQLIDADSVRAFEELDTLMHRYGVRCCVIDANPETRLAQEFAARWNGRVWPAFYPNFAEGSRPDLLAIDEVAGVVRIVRTAILDLEQAMVARRLLVLPRNARELGGGVNQAGVGEFYQHMSSAVRVVEDDTKGNPIVHFQQNGPDHYCHSVAYMLAAMVIAQQRAASYEEVEYLEDYMPSVRVRISG